MQVRQKARLPDPSFWKNKKVFLTGAEGFKGRWLVRWLGHLGAVVRTNGQVSVVDRKGMSDAIQRYQPEIVIHMAAVSTVPEAFADPPKAIETNALGTIILLDILRGVPDIKAILNVTTDKVYHVAGIDRGYIETDALGGLEPYAISKVCSENISTVYQKTYKLPLATARAGNVLGGGDWTAGRIVPCFYEAYKASSVLDVNAQAVRPWQYVLDALNGYLLLCEELHKNDSYVGAWNFGSNEYASRSVQWLVDELNKHTTPKVAYRVIEDRGFYETVSLKLCCDKAHKALGWYPLYSVPETVKRTAEWYTLYLSGGDAESLFDDEIEAFEFKGRLS